MVSQVALFLLTGHSSVSCMDTSYSPSNSCKRLHRPTTCHSRFSNTKKQHFFLRDWRRQFVCGRFTCFYQRQSSEPQMWFPPPPRERSSSSSYSPLPLWNLKHTEMNGFSKMQDLKNFMRVQQIFCDTYGKASECHNKRKAATVNI